MQSYSLKRLRKNNRGVIDLPVKLLVVMIILAVCLPLVNNAVQSNEQSMMFSEMEQETGKIIDSVRAVHFSGIGSSRFTEISLPAGCEIVIGGEGTDAYSIREYYEGNELNVKYVEAPVIKFENSVVITGNSNVLLTSVEGEVPTVSVVIQ